MSLDTLRHNGSEYSSGLRARAAEAASQVSERGREVLQSPEARRIAMEIGGAALDGALDQVSKRGKDGERKLSVVKTARLLANPTGAARRAATGAYKEGRQAARNEAFGAARSAVEYGMNQLGSNSTAPAIEASPDYSYSPSSSYEADPFGNSNETAPSPDWGTPSTDSWESTPAAPSVESSSDRGFSSLRDRFHRKQEAAPTYASEETDDFGDKIVNAPAAPVYAQESSKRGIFGRKKEVAPTYASEETDDFGQRIVRTPVTPNVPSQDDLW